MLKARRRLGRTLGLDLVALGEGEEGRKEIGEWDYEIHDQVCVRKWLLETDRRWDRTAYMHTRSREH